MKASALLRATAHRPWPLPTQPWVLRQTWRALLFAHWPVPAEMVRPLLPPGLTLDRFEEQAWVGVVPFEMTGVRPRGLPGVPRLSHFAEINVRTYATVGGKPGVFFFSLDAGNALAVALARTFFHLPYYTARFEIARAGATLRYASQRSHRGAPPGAFAAIYRPTGPVARARPATLEHWLTERYCLYTTDRHGRLLRGEIHHLPWPLQPAEAEINRETLARAAGLALPATPPLLHYADRLDVLVWPLARG